MRRTGLLGRGRPQQALSRLHAGELDARARHLRAILRDAAGLARGTAALDTLARDIAACGVADASRRYNLTWMDRLNLENLTLVSRAICAAADFRRDSRGAHFREDYPQTSDLAASVYTSVRVAENRPRVTSVRVDFSRVRPGESLLRPAAAE